MKLFIPSNERIYPCERVLSTFNHVEPDRIPVNYFANPGINARLKAYIGIKKNDTEGLLQALGVDFRSVNAPYTGPRLHMEIAGIMVNPLWGSIPDGLNIMREATGIFVTFLLKMLI